MSAEDTIFHKIIRKEIPADIVFEDEEVICFKDVNPVAPFHLLVVPKKSISKLDAAQECDKSLLGHMMYVGTKVAKDLGFSDDGYRFVVNCGEKASQTVFQLHLHVIGGRKFSWPPG